MKVLNILFIVLFVLSAALQYNDPDPLIWMPIYLYGALLCYLAIRGKFKRWWYVLGLTVYGAYALFLLFDKTGVLNWLNEHDAENIVQSMKATKPWIEETREFFGLLLLILALAVNMIVLNRKENKNRIHSSGDH